MRIRYAVFAALLPLAVKAQQPLTAIEWLGENNPRIRSGPVLLEPPVSETALRPDVDVQPLAGSAPPIGLVPSHVTGLPVDLWRGSDPAELANLIATVPVRRSPAMQTLLYTVLLSETRSPANGSDTVLLARLDRLMQLGAVDAAQSLAEVAGPTASAALFERWFDATLLTGDEEKSCAALNQTPGLSDDYRARIFCRVRAGDWETAALTLEVAHALDILPPDDMALLDRFLSPDVFEGAPPLPVPQDPDPLTFRLFETIGENLPTAPLPRMFASADLRDLAGWKAQVEAAERLARIGALPPNRLLGLYTARRAAASGGVWDRITALQRFETALDQQSPDAVAKTLPAVWAGMQSAGLEVPFADLFARPLSTAGLAATGAELTAWHVRLLSADYEAAAVSLVDQTPRSRFLAALALGDPSSVPAPDNTARAISDGFSGDHPLPGGVSAALARGGLGEAILLAMAAFDLGARGNPRDLSGALATLRRIGLEDTARRAALQLMLLDRRG